MLKCLIIVQNIGCGGASSDIRNSPHSSISISTYLSSSSSGQMFNFLNILQEIMTKVKVKKATDDTKMQSAVLILILRISEEKIFDESSNEVDIFNLLVFNATCT